MRIMIALIALALTSPAWSIVVAPAYVPTSTVSSEGSQATNAANPVIPSSLDAIKEFHEEAYIRGFVLCKNSYTDKVRSEGCEVTIESGDGFFKDRKRKFLPWEEYIKHVIGKEVMLTGIAVSYDNNGNREVIVYYIRKP